MAEAIEAERRAVSVLLLQKRDAMGMLPGEGGDERGLVTLQLPAIGGRDRLKLAAQGSVLDLRLVWLPVSGQFSLLVSSEEYRSPSCLEHHGATDVSAW